MLQAADDKFVGGRGIGKIKMVERGGTTLKQLLCRYNPWANEGCGRGNKCFPCKEEGGAGGNCQKEGIVYKITCQECKSKGVSSEYIGESSRTAFLRGSEHLDDLAKKCEGSPLWKHCVEEHNSEEVKFSMKVTGSHRTPLTRQIQESVKIENSTANILMNSKSEYNGSRIPRVVIEVGSRVETEDWPGQGTKKIGSKRSEKGSWKVNNMRKSKREDGAPSSDNIGNEQIGPPECGPAEPGKHKC